MEEKTVVVLLLKPLNNEDKAYGLCSSKLAALMPTPQEMVDLETLSATDKASAVVTAVAGADKEMKSYLPRIPTQALFIIGGVFQDEDPREMKSNEKHIDYSTDTSSWFAKGGASPMAEAWKTQEGKTIAIRDQGILWYGILSCSSNGHVNGRLSPPSVYELVIHSEVNQNGYHYEDNENSEDSEDGEEEEGDGEEEEASAGLGNEGDGNILVVYETIRIGPMLPVGQRDKRDLPTMASFCTWPHQCWADNGIDRVAAQVPDRRNLWPDYSVRVYERGPNDTENIMNQGLDEIGEGWEYSFFRGYVTRVEVQLLV